MDALFDLPGAPPAPAGPMLEATRAQLDALTADRELSPAESLRIVMCAELARSIDKGNSKGRDVTAAVDRLNALVASLAGETAAEADEMSAADQEFMDALAAPPAHAAAEVRHPA